MNKKIFWAIIVIIITITNIILFTNFYISQVENNNQKIVKEDTNF